MKEYMMILTSSHCITSTVASGKSPNCTCTLVSGNIGLFTFLEQLAECAERTASQYRQELEEMRMELDTTLTHTGMFVFGNFSTREHKE